MFNFIKNSIFGNNSTATKHGEDVSEGYLEIVSSTAEDFWLEAGRIAVRDGMRRVEENTKQLVTVLSWSQSGYFAILSFSGIKKIFDPLSEVQGCIAILVIISPMLCWVISMICALNVFKSKSAQIELSNPLACRDFYIKGTELKMSYLKYAHISLVAGFIFLLCNVVLYLVFIPD